MAAHLIRRRFLAFVAAGLMAACLTPVQASAETAVPAAEPVTRLFLVRHGEKEVGSDPALSPAGALRAAALVERLSAEGVTEIWSTATRRTQETAAPLAAVLGLPVQTYDAAELPAFGNQLASTRGVKLVVGHSNTTDALAALIGADPGPPIDDAAEFDRLYVITITGGYQVTSRIERYGAPAFGAETPLP